jgi:hypothetical protein
MTKSTPMINEKQYVKLVNEKMREHDLYDSDMRVELNPNSSNKPLGFTIIGNHNTPAIVSWAEKIVKSEYQLLVTK